MRGATRARALVVPTWLRAAGLAATALGLGSACPDDSESTTDPSAGDDAADTGELPDCMIANESDCAAQDGCTWSSQVEYCVVDCELLDDAETCEAADFCEWADDACFHHAI